MAADGLRIRAGSAADAPPLLALFDDAVAWLVARGQTGQRGTEPFSPRPSAVERVHGWASGGGLRLAEAPAGPVAGAIVLGDAMSYVPPPERPELPGAYERLGFHRVGSFDVDGWPGAVLERSVGRR